MTVAELLNKLSIIPGYYEVLVTSEEGYNGTVLDAAIFTSDELKDHSLDDPSSLCNLQVAWVD